MRTHKNKLITARNLQLVTFAAICVAGSFLMGIQSAGDVQPFARSEAQQANILNGGVVLGDVDGNGIVNVQDALIILEEIQHGSSTLTADVTHDGKISVDDAIAVLQILYRKQ